MKMAEAPYFIGRNSALLRPALRRGLRPLHFFLLSPQNLRILRGPQFSLRRKGENAPCTVEEGKRRFTGDEGRAWVLCSKYGCPCPRRGAGGSLSLEEWTSFSFRRRWPWRWRGPRFSCRSVRLPVRWGLCSPPRSPEARIHVERRLFRPNCSEWRGQLREQGSRLPC